MQSFICILAEGGNSCLNVFATAENIEYIPFKELWKTQVLKVYCQINLLTHINTLIVRDVTLNKIT